LIVIPALTTASRAAAGGRPRLASPSPEMSMTRRAAGCGNASNCAAAASAGPIAVAPRELRLVAWTAAAKRAALVASATRVHPTVTAMSWGPDHSRTDTSIPPGAAAIACVSRGSAKARAMPSRWRMYESAVTLAETSSASTTASAAACAGTAANHTAAITKKPRKTRAHRCGRRKAQGRVETVRSTLLSGRARRYKLNLG
jgi:hypothetical protein